MALRLICAAALLLSSALSAPALARDAIYAADVASGIAAVLLAPTLDHDAYTVGWGRLASSRSAH